jgi:hypothetical protein
MPVDYSKSAGLILPPILAGGLALLILGSVSAVVKQSERLGPAVGDIVAFPASPDPRRGDTRIDATHVAGGHCVIDLAEVRRNGGSFVIEERYPGLPRSYRVHWSGTRTADPGQDCGAAADLDLEVDKVATLALAAGGYGPRAAPPAD